MDCRPSQPRKPKGEAMSRHLLFVLVLATGVALPDDKPEAQAQHAAGAAEAQAETEAAQGQTEGGQAETDEKAKLISVPGAKALGMSILGNQDAPKSLVIVPWKSSELGDSLGISPMLDDSRQPVDKEVFMRSLRYYEIRSKTKQ